MDIVDVVMKLTGPIDPVGDSRIDAGRLANLKTLCELTQELLDRITSVAGSGNDYMASVKAAKDVAAAFLREASGAGTQLIAWYDPQADRIVTAAQMHSMLNNQGGPGKAAAKTYTVPCFTGALVDVRSIDADLLDACKSAVRWLEGWASAEPYLSQLQKAIERAEGLML